MTSNLIESLYKHAITFAPKELKNGKVSPITVNPMLSALDIQGLGVLSYDLFWGIMSLRTGTSYVAAIVPDGCPLATGVSLRSYTEGQLEDSTGEPWHPNLPLLNTLYVQPGTDEGGLFRPAMVQGSFNRHETAVLVAGVLEDGADIIQAAKALRSAGLNVPAVVVVVDLECGGKQKLEAEKIRSHELVTLTQLLNNAPSWIDSKMKPRIKSSGDPILDIRTLCMQCPRSREDLMAAYKELGWGVPFDTILDLCLGVTIFLWADGLYHYIGSELLLPTGRP